MRRDNSGDRRADRARGRSGEGRRPVSADRQCRRRPGRRPRRRSRSRPTSSTTRIPNLATSRSPRTPACPVSAAPRSSSTFIDHQGNPSVAQQQALRLITQDKVHVAVRRLSVVLHASPRRRSPSATAFRSWSAIQRAPQHHRPRLQMGLPRHADRDRLRRDLHALLRRHEEGRHTRSSSIAIVNENTDYGTSVARRGRGGGQEGRASRSRSAFPTAQARPTSRRRCCS